MNNQEMFRSLIVVAAMIGALPALVRAQYTGIYTFDSQGDACCAGHADLMAQGQDGNLYGTMPTGVSSTYYGTWFEYPIGGQPMIHNLSGGPFQPKAGLTLGIDGNLYGATVHGGPNNYGMLVKVSNGVMTPIYTFTGGAGGSYPNAPPIQGPDGNLYGVTNDGSTSGHVYQFLTASGTLGWVVPLPSGSDAPLILASDGNFYGTFPHGNLPVNGVAGSNNNGGAVFQVTPSGVLSGVYNIGTNTGDGQVPWGPVMQGSDGNLYGTASGGGAYNGGVVFQLTLSHVYKVIHSFQSPDGTDPEGGLVQGSDGFFYGLTSRDGWFQQLWVHGGGPLFKAGGTLFKVDSTGANFSRLFTFTAYISNDVGSGMAPLATPTIHTNGLIYGLTSLGGFTGNGQAPGTQGAFDDGGELFSFNAGLKPFVSVVGQRSAHVGDRVSIIGQGFLNATGIRFGNGSVPWTKQAVSIWSDNYMTVTVPSGATTGPVTVTETTGTLSTPYNFTIPCTFLYCLHLP